MPVRFADQVEALYAAGARCFIEVGPGSVLTDLAAVCLEGRPHLAVAMDAKGRDSVTAFWFALAKLAAAGISIDTAFAWRNYAVEPLSAAKPSPMAIPITGSELRQEVPGKYRIDRAAGAAAPKHRTGARNEELRDPRRDRTDSSGDGGSARGDATRPLGIAPCLFAGQ